MWNQVSYDPPSCESNLCTCVYSSLKMSGLQTGFKPVTSRYWADAPTHSAMKPLMLGGGNKSYIDINQVMLKMSNSFYPQLRICILHYLALRYDNIWVFKQKNGYSLLYQSQGQDRRHDSFWLVLPLQALIAMGLSAFIYFGQVTKGYDAFGPLFLCPSECCLSCLSPWSLPHISYWTRTQSDIIDHLLVGDWFVQQSANKPQTQWERDLMQMWAAISLGEHCVICAKRQLQRRHWDPFFAAF